VPLVQALEICGTAAGNTRIEKVILESVKNVSSGHPLHESLSRDALFPDMTIQMIAVGEKIGELPKMMERVALFYDGEVSAAVDGVLSNIEPVMIVFLAIVIGVILIAMYLPLFDMMTGLN
jgi:type IV pilus assembly protein PilC